MDILVYNEDNKPTKEEKDQIIDFLYDNLEQFGDSKLDIEKAINYSLQENNSDGGFILKSVDNDLTQCIVVVNKTGMNGYIPDNILVYIATHKNYRGKGIGKELMKKAIETAEGDIALHVEPNNPAKYLYEKLGFTNKYLEMRYKK